MLHVESLCALYDHLFISAIKQLTLNFDLLKRKCVLLLKFSYYICTLSYFWSRIAYLGNTDVP